MPNLPPHPSSSKVIQISTAQVEPGQTEVYALTESGEIWVYGWNLLNDRAEWYKLDPIPGGKAARK